MNFQLNLVEFSRELVEYDDWFQSYMIVTDVHPYYIVLDGDRLSYEKSLEFIIEALWTYIQSDKEENKL